MEKEDYLKEVEEEAEILDSETDDFLTPEQILSGDSNVEAWDQCYWSQCFYDSGEVKSYE